MHQTKCLARFQFLATIMMSSLGLPYKSIANALKVSGFKHHRSTKKAKAASDISPSSSSPCLKLFVLATAFQDGVSRPQTGG